MSLPLRTLRLAACASACLLAVGAQAQLSVNSASYTYTQDFNTLATTGSPSWLNDSTLAGWSLFNRLNQARDTYLPSAGGSATGSFYSFGSSTSVNGAGERALGGIGNDAGTYWGATPGNDNPVGQAAGWMALALKNESGTALNGLTLRFDGEQWRRGTSNPVGRVDTMVLEYGFGASFVSVSGWTAPGGSFNWTSPVAAADTTASLDGNAAANRVAGLGGTLSLNWAAGDTLWIRWVERNDTNVDHGLAIDNVNLSVSAVPEPQTQALLLAGLLVVGSLARRKLQ